MKKKKSKKKIIIGAAAVLVVAGGVTVAGQRNSTENQIPQVQVVIAEKGDVEEIVDATGTVGSEEEKTYYSPVNAELKTVSFDQGDVVKKGTKLIEFNTEDLEKDNRKAELNLKSTKYDTKDTRNKSDKAEKKQKDAKKNVQELEKKIKDKKAYVSSLKSQISAAAAAAQREAAVPGYRVGGKTATSEIQPEYDSDGKVLDTEDRYTASFIGVAPMDDPQIAVLVAINDLPESATHTGGTIAAPVVGRIMEDVLPYIGITPVYDDSESDRRELTVPSVSGKTRDDAISTLSDAGFDCIIKGDGDTVRPGNENPSNDSFVPYSPLSLLQWMRKKPHSA